MLPPSLPLQSIYTSCYCEENICLLCQTFLKDQTLMDKWQVFAVFLSNMNKTVALWSQKASRSADDPVIWDYHVILVLRPKKHDQDTGATSLLTGHDSWVYDFDTRLAQPCQWEEYVGGTFLDGIPSEYERYLRDFVRYDSGSHLLIYRFSQFRVIQGDIFLQHFASDRSHMLLNAVDSSGTEPNYSMPPPAYPPICGTLASQKGITNNLMERYVAMDEMTAGADADSYGLVLNRDEVDAFFSDGDKE